MPSSWALAMSRARPCPSALAVTLARLIARDVPHVDELGVTSGPLKSASFFLASFCKDYSEDFMLCRNESADPEHCLKEGRRATRCAQELCVLSCCRARSHDSFGKLGMSCGDEWKAHWTCLENSNHEFSRCRKVEKPFNDCVFEQLVRAGHVVALTRCRS